MLKASFVRTIGERDRIYVTRSDGSEVHWAFPTYGHMPPHDLIHLVVESGFGVVQGFWGRVDGGADPSAINAEANRIGGRDKYASFGPDATQLLLAEALANAGWYAAGASLEAVQERILTACRESRLTAPALLSTERIGQVRVVLTRLARQWRALDPKGTIRLDFDPGNPVRCFEQLAKEQARDLESQADDQGGSP